MIQTAIPAIGSLRDTESIDVLRRLAADAAVDDAVRQRAQWGVDQLS